MHANKLVVYFVCRWKALVNLPPSERWGKTFGLPATETYFSVACERICKSNGAELGGPTLRLMLIMPRHRLAYCEVMPPWLSQGKAVVVLWRYGQPQHVRVMDAYCCAATQSRWLGSRWSHFNCVWSYCWHKMKAVTVNVQKSQAIKGITAVWGETVQTCLSSFPAGNLHIIHIHGTKTHFTIAS